MSKYAPMDRLPLFSPQPDTPGYTSGPDPRSHNSDPETSHQAAASMKDTAETHRRIVLQTLKERGPLTGHEINAIHGWPYPTANRRLPELRDAGLVTMLPDTRPTPTGRKARLWAFKEDPCFPTL